MIHPPFFLIHKTFRYPKFSETQTCSPTKLLDSVGQKFNSTKNDIPFLCVKLFDTPFFSETQKGSTTMFFDTVRHQLFDGKMWCPPFLLSIPFSDARIFFKHRRDLVQSFSQRWDKRLPTEFSDVPFLCKRCFDTRTYLKHGKGPLRNFSALWDKIFSIEINDMPFLCIKFFDTRIFLKHRRFALRNFLVLWDTDFDKISWYTTLLSYP